MEKYIPGALQQYFAALNEKPEEGKSDRLLKFYNEKSKLTLGERKLGPEHIVELLRKEQREFGLDSYTVGSKDDHHCIITGQLISGNSKMTFVMVLEGKEDPNSNEWNLSISNQIINL